MQLFSQNKSDYSKLVLLMGRYFQIRDDYCNLSQQEVLINDIFCFPEPVLQVDVPVATKFHNSRSTGSTLLI